MPAQNAVTDPQEPVAKVKSDAVKAVDPTEILQALMAEIQQMKADRETEKQQFSEELAEAQRKADAAADAASRTIVDPVRPNVLPDNAIDPRTDHPASISEKLDCMEVSARENGQPFDRERTRRVLIGLPVEDLYEFRLGYRVFDSQAELDAFKQKMEDEKIATIGKFLR